MHILNSTFWLLGELKFDKGPSLLTLAWASNYLLSPQLIILSSLNSLKTGKKEHMYVHTGFKGIQLSFRSIIYDPLTHCAIGKQFQIAYALSLPCEARRWTRGARRTWPGCPCSTWALRTTGVRTTYWKLTYKINLIMKLVPGVSYLFLAHATNLRYMYINLYFNSYNTLNK